MSRKFGKFLLFSAVAGAAAYGTYHYLKSKEGAPAPGETDTDDDFDDFGEDLDDEEGVTRERSYVSLNLDKAEAFASEAFHRAKEVIVDSVQQVKDTVKSVTEGQAAHDSAFTDLTAVNKEKEAEKTAADAGDGDCAAADGADAGQAAQTSDDMTEITAQSADAKAEQTPSPQTAPTEPAAGTVEEFFDDNKN